MIENLLKLISCALPSPVLSLTSFASSSSHTGEFPLQCLEIVFIYLLVSYYICERVDVCAGTHMPHSACMEVRRQIALHISCLPLY